MKKIPIYRVSSGTTDIYHAQSLLIQYCSSVESIVKFIEKHGIDDIDKLTIEPLLCIEVNSKLYLLHELYEIDAISNLRQISFFPETDTSISKETIKENIKLAMTTS